MPIVLYCWLHNFNMHSLVLPVKNFWYIWTFETFGMHSILKNLFSLQVLLLFLVSTHVFLKSEIYVFDEGSHSYTLIIFDNSIRVTSGCLHQKVNSGNHKSLYIIYILDQMNSLSVKFLLCHLQWIHKLKRLIEYSLTVNK